MEISEEIKQKIVYQYFGQKYLYKNEFGTFKGVVGEYHTNEHLKNKSFILMLKPLNSITDEEFDKCWETIQESHDTLSKDWLKHHFKNQGNKQISMCVDLFSYQYLISKGYDLPHYLLGGKTLKESGLAI